MGIIGGKFWSGRGGGGEGEGERGGRSRSTVDMPLFRLTFPPVVARRRERQHRSARPPSSSHRGSGPTSRGRLARPGSRSRPSAAVLSWHPARVLYHAIPVLQGHGNENSSLVRPPFSETLRPTRRLRGSRVSLRGRVRGREATQVLGLPPTPPRGSMWSHGAFASVVARRGSCTCLVGLALLLLVAGKYEAVRLLRATPTSPAGTRRFRLRFFCGIYVWVCVCVYSYI